MRTGFAVDFILSFWFYWNLMKKKNVYSFHMGGEGGTLNCVLNFFFFSQSKIVFFPLLEQKLKSNANE